ncbi:MAG: response regulator [Myxococcota bacterium]
MRAEFLNILVVDDDPIDVMAFQRAARRCGWPNRVTVAASGEEALALVRGLAAPKLVLLDIRMPGMGGLETLRQLRADPALTHTCVFMLTSSDDPSDVDAAYRLHANAFVVKQSGADGMRAIVERIRSFAELVELPQRAGAA